LPQPRRQTPNHWCPVGVGPATLPHPHVGGSPRGVDPGKAHIPGLLRDAIFRVLHVADTVGVRGVLAHAISDEAKRFDLARGFLKSPLEPMMRCLPVETARAALAGPTLR